MPLITRVNGNRVTVERDGNAYVASTDFSATHMPTYSSQTQLWVPANLAIIDAAFGGNEDLSDKFVYEYGFACTVGNIMDALGRRAYISDDVPEFGTDNN